MLTRNSDDFRAMASGEQTIFRRPLDIKLIFDYTIRLYRRNFIPMLLAMAIVQLPLVLILMPFNMKALALITEMEQMPVIGEDFSTEWMWQQFDILLPYLLLAAIAPIYQVLVLPLGNLACAWLARESAHDRSGTIGDALRFAASRYWPTQVALATFLLPLLGLSVVVLLIVLLFSALGMNTAVMISAVIAMIVIQLGALVTWILAPRFIFALNGIIQTAETPSQRSVFRQGMYYLRRAWELTRGNQVYFRLVGYLLLMSVATNMVNQGVSETINTIGSFIAASREHTSIDDQFWASMNTTDLTSAGIAIVFAALVSLVIVPVWQNFKLVLYYDRRCRHEGYDLLQLVRLAPGISHQSDAPTEATPQ
jgi:hypothetical protein